MEAMRNEIGHWSNRDLTPVGKITVLKSLILSNFATQSLKEIPKRN